MVYCSFNIRHTCESGLSHHPPLSDLHQRRCMKRPIIDSHVSIWSFFSVDEGCWTEFANTHSLMSEPNPADSLEACQDACLNNESCDGVDWNQRQSPGRQCWLIGPWTTTRQVSFSGINQYVINRTNCDTSKLQ